MSYIIEYDKFPAGSAFAPSKQIFFLYKKGWFCKTLIGTYATFVAAELAMANRAKVKTVQVFYTKYGSKTDFW